MLCSLLQEKPRIDCGRLPGGQQFVSPRGKSIFCWHKMGLYHCQEPAPPLPLYHCQESAPAPYLLLLCVTIYPVWRMCPFLKPFSKDPVTCIVSQGFLPGQADVMSLCVWGCCVFGPMGCSYLCIPTGTSELACWEWGGNSSPAVAGLAWLMWLRWCAQQNLLRSTTTKAEIADHCKYVY